MLFRSLWLSMCGMGHSESVANRLKGFATPEIMPVKTQMILKHASLKPGSETKIGVLFELEAGWHIYAEKPGDAGLPTTIVWNMPAGVTAGALEWPKPQEFLDPGDIKTFGYSGTTFLMSSLSTSSALAKEKPATLQAHVEWLACKDICLPGSTDLEMAVPVSQDEPLFSTHEEFFDQGVP